MRCTRKCIITLNTIRGRSVQFKDIKGEVKDHFQRRFQEPILRRSNFDGVSFKQLRKINCDELEWSFQYEEIKDVVWLSAGEKKPGPNGFNMGF